MSGYFITFEGPDGAGKTTQVKRLASELENRGYRVIVTREPGGTEISDQIRAILLHPDHRSMADQTEVLLYAASRAQHVHQTIKPALERGDIVLCDRFIDASIAYQAYGLGIDEQVVRSINAFASSGLQPNRTYMLDLSAEVGRDRILARTGGQSQGLDRIEQKELDYHRRVREGFGRIAAQEPSRVCRIDANRSIDEITSDILTDCLSILPRGING